jgi:serine phosphatase RsbU (regulator of sigma subunit)
MDPTVLLESLPFGVLALHQDGSVRWASTEAARLLGAHPDDLSRRPLTEILGDDLEPERKYLEESRGRPHGQRFVEKDVVPPLRSDKAVLCASVARVSPHAADGHSVLLRDVSAERIEQAAMEKAADIIEQRLENENRRKSEELEKARVLQQSMLPNQVPDDPAFDVAAHLSTAVEVGGDYFDFILTDSGFVALVGDATGHGLEAGMMVTVTKSLLLTIDPNGNPADVLRSVNTGLRSLRLPRVYMCLAAARIEPDAIMLASAGIPPALVYRHATGSVEEFRVRGMMLGAATGLPFESVRIAMHPGDHLLLMSDGFPERFNPAHEELGYDRAGALMRQCCPCNSNELIESLMDEANQFAAGEPMNDDMTLLAVRYK